ncbi:MAG: ABC transporter ATP-binding protein [Bowdeniella nasicola]|nr:ABC transporter ATP-binding protein [Bowdeniella nasicola]
MKNKNFWAWALDILLIGCYYDTLTDKGRRNTRLGVVYAAILGVLEGMGLFAVIPTVTTFVSGGTFLGLGWIGWVIVLAIMAVAGAVITYVQSYTTYMGAMDLLETSNQSLGNKIARLPLGWFNSKSAGIVSRLTGGSILEIGNGAAHLAGVIVRSLLTTLTMALLSWLWSWRMGAVFTLALPLVLLLSVAARALKSRSEGLTAPRERELASRIVEFTQTQPALRAHGAAHAYAPLAKARTDAHRSRRHALWLDVVANLLNGVGAQAVVVAIIALAAWMAVAGTMTPVATIAFIGVALRYMWVLGDFTNFLLGIEHARAALLEMREILDTPELPTPQHEQSLTAPGEVSFEQVNFSYAPGEPVLRDINVHIPARSFTAIVGPSGSGKSTLFRLAARFWDVDSGTVRVGGVDVRDQPTEQLMRQLAMVFQDVYLYDTTLIENIRVGNPAASEEEIRAAGRLAGVEEIAQRLPGGWDAPVGEGGKRLSGGERQRVSVARALLKQAPIVLFDEATSALDPENESQIEQAIAQLREQATVVVIAHKLGTIEAADHILVLDHDGRLVQTGTHDELLAEGGMYGRLFAARRDAQGWSLTAEVG